MSAFDEMHEDGMQEWLDEMAEEEFDASTGRKGGDDDE